MADLLRGTNVSTAWVVAMKYLLSLPSAECSNLIVAIDNPTEEDREIRTKVDEFGEALRKIKNGPPRIDTVAGTIFPNAFYRPSARDPERHLYELERRVRSVVRRHPQNRRGTYFERLIAYPAAKTNTLNQLERALERLRRAKQLRYRNDNRFELSIFHPGRDTNPIGFPCLSHISITLREGALDAAALYRNQYFVERAYGNFLGIGQLMTFLARESGFVTGELVCIASHARAEVGAYGRARLEEGLKSCLARLDTEYPETTVTGR